MEPGRGGAAAPSCSEGSGVAERLRVSLGDEKRAMGGRAHLGGPGAERLRFFAGEGALHAALGIRSLPTKPVAADRLPPWSLSALRSAFAIDAAMRRTAAGAEAVA